MLRLKEWVCETSPQIQILARLDLEGQTHTHGFWFFYINIDVGISLHIF
jgi:hypothetical protein